MNSENVNEDIVNIMTLGISSVGKTSFIFRFTENTFQNIFISTIGIDYKVKIIEIENIKYKLIFYDTAGQEKFKSVAPNLIKKAHGIIIMYDITNKSSFDSIPDIIKNIKGEKGNDFPMILIGNKIDLEPDREIKKEEGKDLASKNGIEFFEISNKEGINIQEAGFAIVNKILEKRKINNFVNESCNNTNMIDQTYYSKYTNIDNDETNMGKCC